MVSVSLHEKCWSFPFFLLTAKLHQKAFEIFVNATEGHVKTETAFCNKFDQKILIWDDLAQISRVFFLLLQKSLQKFLLLPAARQASLKGFCRIYTFFYRFLRRNNWFELYSTYSVYSKNLITWDAELTKPQTWVIKPNYQLIHEKYKTDEVLRSVF